MCNFHVSGGFCVTSFSLEIALARSLKFLSTVVPPICMGKCKVNKAMKKQPKKNTQQFCKDLFSNTVPYSQVPVTALRYLLCLLRSMYFQTQFFLGISPLIFMLLCLFLFLCSLFGDQFWIISLPLLVFCALSLIPYLLIHPNLLYPV